MKKNDNLYDWLLFVEIGLVIILTFLCIYSLIVEVL